MSVHAGGGRPGRRSGRRQSPIRLSKLRSPISAIKSYLINHSRVVLNHINRDLPFPSSHQGRPMAFLGGSLRVTRSIGSRKMSEGKRLARLGSWRQVPAPVRQPFWRGRRAMPGVLGTILRGTPRTLTMASSLPTASSDRHSLLLPNFTCRRLDHSSRPESLKCHHLVLHKSLKCTIVLDITVHAQVA